MSRRRRKPISEKPAPVVKKATPRGGRPDLLKHISLDDYDRLVDEVQKLSTSGDVLMQNTRKAIQQNMVPDLQKGWVQLPNAPPQRSPKTWFYDPLSLQYSLGYKDRRYSLTFETLKQVAQQLGIISAIINLRCAQVASFTKPFRQTRSLGFVIRHKDPEHKTTEAELEFIKELEGFISNCGRSEPNPYSRIERDDFEDWTKKIVRDTLTFDQHATEVVPDGYGLPYEFYAVDAATIRFASDDRYVGVNSSFHTRDGFVPSVPTRFASLYEDAPKYGKGGQPLETRDGNPIKYVQIVNGQIENVYSDAELVVGVRNPRTDLYIQGYGYSEIEQLINTVTAHLYAEEYNRNYFKQGSAPKGILNLKSENWAEDQLEEFKRQWRTQVAGVENAWKTPILQLEQGVDWIDLVKTNREMEFGQWIEYLIKITCGVFKCDPSELNFDLSGGVQQTPLFESSQEWKLKASRDKGLKPLLNHIAKIINKYIIDRIDDHFVLEFVGLDELSETEKHSMLVEQISSYLTLNEARRKMDLPDVPNGDIPMNPVYLQAMELQQQQQQMEQEQQQVQEGEQEAQPGQSEERQLPGANPELEDQGPQYTSQLGLSDPTEAIKSLFDYTGGSI